MLVCVPDVLKDGELQTVRDGLSAVTFVDGKETAQGLAKDVKNNLQASSKDTKQELLRRLVFEKVLSHEMIRRATRPKTISYLMFSKYEPGMSYGSHVDNPFMQGLRSDVSFTLFLSDPGSYDGGELVIEAPSSDQPIKLPAGGIVVYPATSLHRVNPVTRGERLAAVGWIRSYIRQADQREVLFDLDSAKAALKGLPGTEPQRTLINKTISNLVRMWADDMR
ncbi:MAG: Fe2+-dependent dioxygenase [Parvibaculaceae bacterium]